MGVYLALRHGAVQLGSTTAKGASVDVPQSRTLDNACKNRLGFHKTVPHPCNQSQSRQLKKKKAQGFTSKTSAPDPIIFFPTPQTSAYSLRTISPQPLAAVAHILAFPMSAASARAASFALLRVTLAVAFLLDDIAV